MGKKPFIMLASSAGGHFAELKQLNKIIENYEHVIVTEKTEFSNNDKNTHYVIYSSRNEKFKYIFKYAYVTITSSLLFLRYMPDYVISTGVHSTIPLILLAKLFKRKVVYIETIANVYTPSMTGKLIYRFADLFIVQWEELLEVYPNAVYGGSLF